MKDAGDPASSVVRLGSVVEVRLAPGQHQVLTALAAGQAFLRQEKPWSPLAGWASANAVSVEVELDQTPAPVNLLRPARLDQNLLPSNQARVSTTSCRMAQAALSTSRSSSRPA